MKKYIFSSLLLLVLLQGCSKFEDLNKNPNETDNLRSDYFLNNIMYSAFGEDGDVANQTGLYSTFVGGDMGGCWAQHLGKVAYNDEERYRPRTGVVQSFWNTIYEDVCNDADKMFIQAKKENNNVVQGVALTLKAYGFSVLTDCFGNIPFSEALKGNEGIFTPKYDEQEDVYVGILAMLDQADSLLATEVGELPASNDRMFGGRPERWREFANSLKFRCLMRISNKTSAKINVRAQLQQLIDSRPLFNVSRADASFPFGSAQPAANPFYETVVFGSRGEWKVGEALVDKLKNLDSDPRLEVIAKPNALGNYRGKPAGYKNLPSEDYGFGNVSAIGDYYLQPSSPATFLTYAQLCFLIAEAQTRGLISGVDAEFYYFDGVRESFLLNGLSESDFDDYKSTGVLDLNPDPTIALSQIRTQEWIALFGQGVEAWTEWRRTKTPSLTPAVDGFIDEIPSRYQYPLSEQSVNGTSYTSAVASQGPDLLTTKIWWLKP